MNFEEGSKLFHDKDISMVYGKQDPFLTDTRFAEMRDLTKMLNAQVKEIAFDGGHDIDEATLLSLVK
jgi:hypothetical protein